MSTTISIYTVVEGDSGSEFKRIERVGTRTVGDAILERKVTLVAGNVAGSQATLWDSAVDAFAAGWIHGLILVDCNGEGGAGIFADDDANAKVAIDFVGDAVSTPAFNVRRETIFQFSSSAAGGPAGGGLATIDGAITQIRARNNNTVPATGSADIGVRLVLFGP